MAGYSAMAPRPLPALFLLLLAAPCILGSYIVTTPRHWIRGDKAQLCVFVIDGAAPAGKLNLTMTVWDRNRLPEERNQTVLVQILNIPSGHYEKCHEIQVPDSEAYSGHLHMTGQLSGLKMNDTILINLRRNEERTFVQTDRYKYRPGEKVQFRILTIRGRKMEVSYEKYPEIWITNPSRNRIAQWKNQTTSGILHLDFQLADEPEEGNYVIHVKTPQRKVTRNFRVEEFVLPRFEVKIKEPEYILGIDDDFTFDVCVNYTYGQPVKGNLSFSISNNQDSKCFVSRTANTTIQGCKDFTFTAEEMQMMDCRVDSLRTLAIVEEEGTGVQLSATSNKYIDRRAVKFTELYTDEFMKPNIPYTLKVRAELPNGSPAPGVPVEVCAAGTCANKTTPTDGILTLLLPNYKSNNVLIQALNCRAGMYSSEYNRRIEHYYSPSNSSLHIIAPENKLPCSPSDARKHVLTVIFSARNQAFADLTVQIVSRGQIQHTSTRNITLKAGNMPFNESHFVEPLPPPISGTVRGTFDLDLLLPPTAGPNARVLVWYTRADKEVVSHVRELEIERCLANNVSLKWSKPKGHPGDAASVTLRTEPNSLCSLGVVDRSTELLSPDPDPIHVDKLFNFLDSFTIYKWSRSQINDHDYCNRLNRQKVQQQSEVLHGSILPIPRPIYGYYSTYYDAIKMFSDAGLYVLTDLSIENRPCERRNYASFDAFGGRPVSASLGPAAAPPQAEFAITQNKVDSREPSLQIDSSSESDAPRTNFPETWLWEVVVVPSSGTNEKNVTLPDTITQWVGKAVCVHPKAGVGLSERESIITFTPFFVDLTLPPTVKRGETLPVKMSVFNYHNKPLPIIVTLLDSVEYDIIKEKTNPGVRGKRSACIPADDKVVLTVRVKPKIIGDMNLTVSAAVSAAEFPTCGEGENSPQRKDALIRPIKVEAEGFPREDTWSKYICDKDFKTGEDSLETWELALPQNLVEGSERAWVTTVGDLLALSLENLGHLIRMPYGCGEQNMLNFAPNIYLLQYLNTTRQATPESTRKLEYYMNTGYQRQLLYRRNNGSYSAFGNADESGSTWLTAFVLKSFSRASNFIQIDEEKLNDTRSWLLEQQDETGCFRSVGKLLQKSLQGGVSNTKTPAPLTAYVLISLLEDGNEINAKALANATSCLIKVSSQHPYTLALKAYALALAKHADAALAMQQLEDIATVTMNSMHWELSRDSGWTRSAAVETAGYAVMAMMTLDPTANEPKARKIVKWLTTQRNGRGGFYGTQDTVVGLEALTIFESYRHQGPLNVTVLVTATNVSHSFTVTDDNKLLQQQKTLSTLPTKVTLYMTGKGCAMMQAVLRYNIPTPEPSDVFDLTVNAITVADRLCVTKRITACASYHLPDGASNMVVIEVNLVSGYIPEKEDLKQTVASEKHLKRYEVDGSKINFYADELTKNSTCVNFRVTRVVDVENVKPGTVVVYDYYQDEFSISMKYRMPPNDECL